MASIITATTTSGLTQSADNSGVLQLASGVGNLVTVPAVTGTAMVSSNMPSFGVSANGSTQSVGAGVSAKLTNLVTTGTANIYYWDTASCWDNTNKRFVPNVAGYYIFNASVAIAVISSGANLGISILRNGTGKVGFRFNNGGPNDAYINTSCMYYMNGTTDYVELFFDNLTAGSLTVRGEQQSVWFNGSMTRGA